MWVQEKKIEQAYKRWEDEGKQGAEPERPMSDAQMRRALVEDARGVIALLPDFDTAIGDVGQVAEGPETAATPEHAPAARD